MRVPKKIRLGNLPTPLELSCGLSELVAGKEIWVKRDDLTGTALTGNKVRKLELLAADAKEKGCDFLVTCGGIQSNHARATAIVASMLGMGSYLILRGEEPDYFQGNLLLDKILGARIKFITPLEYKNRNEIMQEACSELELEGKKGYIIPEGGSNALGSMGYVDAVCEIKSQLEEAGTEMDAVIVPLGSGGTYTGLLVGAKYFGWETKIIGVNVCDDQKYFRNKVKEISSDMNSLFKLDVKLEDDDIRIFDSYVGAGYAKSRREERDLISQIASKTGMFLDPVYTVKSFLGMQKEAENGGLDNVERILFWHTGGVFGLFSFNTLF